MAEMDQGIKRLLQSHPAEILALALRADVRVERISARLMADAQFE